VHLIRTFVRNVQHGATRLAMHRVAIMALQPTDRAWKSNFGGRQQRLRKIQEQSHAEDHDDDRYQATRRARQGDIAETGRRQRGNRKIERVGIIGDLFIVRTLGFIDNSGHHEDEHSECRGGENDFFIPSKKRTVGSQLRRHPKVAKQRQRSKGAQKTASFA